ncbi:hypothetical protein E2542_SST12432 [Spatholobus suberectus]|nr:hypothetical protein E2542_SST12432 [Spatholobus suberectus]
MSSNSNFYFSRVNYVINIMMIVLVVDETFTCCYLLLSHVVFLFYPLGGVSYLHYIFLGATGHRPSCPFLNCASALENQSSFFMTFVHDHERNSFMLVNTWYHSYEQC